MRPLIAPLVLLMLLSAGCTALDPAPPAASILPPAPPSWGIVNVSADVDLVSMAGATGPRSLWLGIGAWTFSPPPPWADASMSSAFLEAHPRANLARLVRSTGFRVEVAAYETLDAAKHGGPNASYLVTDVASTYGIVEFTPPQEALKLRVTIGDAVAIMDLEAGSIMHEQGGEWIQPEPGVAMQAQLVGVHVLVEEECADHGSEGSMRFTCPALANA